VTAPIVVKVGGELLSTPASTRELADVLARCAQSAPLVVVHGGGREIDAALRQAGIAPRLIDGVRVTDEGTLAVVTSVLAGLVNSRLVAAMVNAGAAAVGLTGADARTVTAKTASPLRALDGTEADLGFVGVPDGLGSSQLLIDLVERGYVPVLASLGLGDEGCLLNVNADAFAADLAARLGSERLIIAGGTSGVLDADGHPLAELDRDEVEAFIAAGGASAGMVVKLRSAMEATAAGVPEVIIANGTLTDVLASLIVNGRANADVSWTSIRTPAGARK
jgi:acetylglutamate kinase